MPARAGVRGLRRWRQMGSAGPSRAWRASGGVEVRETGGTPELAMGDGFGGAGWRLACMAATSGGGGAAGRGI